VFRPVLGPTQPPIQWVPGALRMWVKRPGRETHHSHPSTAVVTMRGSVPPLPHYAFMAWCSVKAQVQPYLLPSVRENGGGNSWGLFEGPAEDVLRREGERPREGRHKRPGTRPRHVTCRWTTGLQANQFKEGIIRPLKLLYSYLSGCSQGCIIPEILKTSIYRI
jgi:hypothetical protein